MLISNGLSTKRSLNLRVNKYSIDTKKQAQNEEILDLLT